MKYGVLALVIFTLMACTARPELPQEIRNEQINEKYALVVGTLSRAVGFESFDRWSLYFRSIDTKKIYENKIEGKVDKKVPFGRYDFDFSEYAFTGNLFAYIVPVGKYEIYRTELVHSYAYTVNKWESDPEFSIQFEVLPGKVTYIGEYAIQPVLNGSNLFGVPITSSGLWTIDDRSERDLKMFEKKYPNINWKMTTLDIAEQPEVPYFNRK